MYNPSENQATPWGHSTSAPPPPGATSPPPRPPALRVGVETLTPTAPPGVSQPWHPPVPTPKKRRSGTQRAVLAAGLVVAMFGVLSIVAIVAMLTLGESALSSSVPTDALIGECYVRSETPLEPVSCDEPHDFEVYSYIEFLESPYPSRSERLAGVDACQEDFESYTGEDFWWTSLDYSIPYPTEAEWNAGQSATVCVLHDGGYETLQGSHAR